MRILIAEDDPVLADGLTRSLRQADYAVDCVNAGDQADHVLLAQSYDLVILDLGLPKLDGFEVLRRLRRRGSKIPVLVLTARDAIDDRVKGLDLGADRSEEHTSELQSHSEISYAVFCLKKKK